MPLIPERDGPITRYRNPDVIEYGRPKVEKVTVDPKALREMVQGFLERHGSYEPKDFGQVLREQIAAGKFGPQIVTGIDKSDPKVVRIQTKPLFDTPIKQERYASNIETKMHAFIENLVAEDKATRKPDVYDPVTNPYTMKPGESSEEFRDRLAGGLRKRLARQRLSVAADLKTFDKDLRLKRKPESQRRLIESRQKAIDELQSLEDRARAQNIDIEHEIEDEVR